MRRVSISLLLALALLALTQTLALAEADAPAFNAEAFRRNFVAGLSGRPNVPALTPESVQVDQVDKAATFGGLDIYAVKGRLAPEGGQSQPFLLFVSADGQFHVSDIISLAAGRSILKDARDRMRAADVKSLGHVIMKGTPGKPVVVYVSDPFCPYCRTAFALLMGKAGSFSELRLAHFPLASHPGADIACAILAWAEAKAPKKALDFVRFAYTELKAPAVPEKTPEALGRAWNEVAASFLVKFPELKALGKNGAAIVAALSDSAYARVVAEDMAKASGLEITGTPVVFVGDVRVVGFDEERLNELLK